jgi:hypothetical protein
VHFGSEIVVYIPYRLLHHNLERQIRYADVPIDRTVWIGHFVSCK